jgi:uncharacterized small protein (DUF1192 family)
MVVSVMLFRFTCANRRAGSDNALAARRKGAPYMTEEPAEARRQRGQSLIDLAREDLELYGVEELAARIAGLEAEIARARTQIARKQASRAAADAFFKR